MRDVLKIRILVAIPIVAFLLAAVFLQGWVLAAFAVLVAVIGQIELCRALGSSPARPVVWIPVAYETFLATCFLVDFSLPETWSVSFLVPGMILGGFVVCVITAFLVAMLARTGSFSCLTSTIFALVYPALFTASFFVLVTDLTPRGHSSYIEYMHLVLVLLMLFVPPALSDTVAYFWGSRFGRTKLAPAISPKKTVAGSVAGVVGGAAGAALVYAVVTALGSAGARVPYKLDCGLTAYLLMGAVLAVLSQFGDLAASYVKRYAQVKDFSNLLPGHGGVLDRTDSTVFVMPLILLFAACSWLGIAPVN